MPKAIAEHTSDVSLLELDDVLPILRDPDAGRPLVRSPNGLKTLDDAYAAPLVGSVPVLLPSRLHPFIDVADGCLRVPLRIHSDALLQYFMFASIKQDSGPPNSDHADPWYERHLGWSKQLCATARGVVLDIGCDDPSLGATCMPPGTRYFGLDSRFGPGPFRLGGVAEFLPIADQSIDGVCFLTSLDHVMDYHRAIDEAHRVLKPGGQLFLASLVWTERAELFHDHVHFHHFREAALMSALLGWRLDHWERRPWKDAHHRSVIYARFTRP